MRIDRLAAPELGEAWSLVAEARVRPDPPPGRALRIGGPQGELRIEAPGPYLAEALRRMTMGPVSLRNVLPDFPAYDTEPGGCGAEASQLHQELTVLRFLVERTLVSGTSPLLTVAPLTRDAVFAPRALPPGRRGQDAELDAWVRLRHTESGRWLTAPRAAYRVCLHRPEAAWLVGCLRGVRSAELRAAASRPELAQPPAVVDAGAAYLVAAGLAGFDRPEASSGAALQAPIE